MAGTLQPGPLLPLVLRRQNHHRSSDIWDGADYTSRTLRHRMHLRNFGDVFRSADPRVLQYIRLAGFYGIYRLGSRFEIDDALITALVDRWRPETHTFHLTVGEATITLQDVAVLLGLRVHGHAVTNHAVGDWPSVCQQYLGVVPPEGHLKGSSVSVAWLRAAFAALPDDADDGVIQCHARAYILLLMQGVVFADSSGGKIQLIYLPLLADLERAGQYSWGSATLAFFYRQMCRAAQKNKADITGPVILLQLWAWERIPIGRPRVLYVPKEGATDKQIKAATTRHSSKIVLSLSNQSVGFC